MIERGRGVGSELLRRPWWDGVVLFEHRIRQAWVNVNAGYRGVCLVVKSNVMYGSGIVARAGIEAVGRIRSLLLYSLLLPGKARRTRSISGVQ
jgi:hypothetical protein